MNRTGARFWRPEVLWGVVGVFALASACVEPPKPVAPGPTPEAPAVLVLKSSDNALLDGPAKTFVEEAQQFANVYSLSLTQLAKGRVGMIKAINPSLVFALGSKAARLVRNKLPEVPVLFAMVVNYGRFDELGEGKAMGVSLELPPFMEFSQFKLVLPELKKVLVFYSPENSSEMVKQAQEELSKIGIELVLEPVTDTELITERYAIRHKEVDAVWLANDPKVMDAKVFRLMRNLTHEQGVPFLASLSDKFAQAGALMSVSVDFSSIGYQAASMASRHIKFGEPVGEIGIQPPIGGRLVLNMDVARVIDLDVAPAVLPFVNEVIDSQRQVAAQ